MVFRLLVASAGSRAKQAIACELSGVSASGSCLQTPKSPETTRLRDPYRTSSSRQAGLAPETADEPVRRTAAWIASRVQAGVAADRKLARQLSLQLAASLSGAEMQPFYILPVEAWSGRPGHVLAIELDVWPSADWNRQMLPSTAAAARALGTCPHPGAVFAAQAEFAIAAILEADAIVQDAAAQSAIPLGAGTQGVIAPSSAEAGTGSHAGARCPIDPQQPDYRQAKAAAIAHLRRAGEGFLQEMMAGWRGPRSDTRSRHQPPR